MGWSESDSRCKRHPNHKQAPGVCSSCLRERLSQLSTSNNLMATHCSSSFSSFSSTYSSAAASSSASPRPLPLFVREKNAVTGTQITRSRSLAFVSRDGDIVVVPDRMVEKKSGFWSKLIRSSSKRRKGDFLHSRTVKERPVTAK